jgi:hypothetical protein
VRFYLGTHETSWLGRVEVPLFVSHRRLRMRRRFKPSTAPWALDSGGFTELDTRGEWSITPGEYIDAVCRYRSEIGRLEWCAPQDWMCEPRIRARTGLSVREHQARTIGSFVELAAAEIPVIPVLQGWAPGDYLEHVEMYDRAGIDLAAWPLVGLGSVCRRQATAEIGQIVASLDGIALHGFGVKQAGLRRYGHQLASADSMAWSYSGWRDRQDGCPVSDRKNCANCLHYALEWRDRVLS